MMSPKLFIAALGAVFLSSCQHCVTTTWGTKVCLTPCKPLVRYQGQSFSIGDTTIPISGVPVTIGGVQWDTKKLQEAATIIQAMDNKRVRMCEERSADLQTLNYADYIDKEKQRQSIGEKLDQLAFLVAANNPAAVERWITAYIGNGDEGEGARIMTANREPAVQPVRSFLAE